jgi:hypothetical protein
LNPELPLTSCYLPAGTQIPIRQDNPAIHRTVNSKCLTSDEGIAFLALLERGRPLNNEEVQQYTKSSVYHRVMKGSTINGQPLTAIPELIFKSEPVIKPQIHVPPITELN